VLQFESGQNCSDCLLRQAQPQLRALSGSYERRPTWVSLFPPIEHRRRLLERVTEESDRQQIINLLAEEQQKQKDAGDPVW
jgi:hypothetical protein